MKTLFAVLILSITALGECPVTVMKLTTTFSDHIRVLLVNNVGKNVTGIKLRLVTYDAVNDPHTNYPDLTASRNIKPGSREGVNFSKPALYSYGYRENTSNGVEVYIQKIEFNDQTFWEDDGSKSCRGQDHDRAKHK